MGKTEDQAARLATNEANQENQDRFGLRVGEEPEAVQPEVEEAPVKTAPAEVPAPKTVTAAKVAEPPKRTKKK
jgi:hypothetical protein